MNKVRLNSLVSIPLSIGLVLAVSVQTGSQEKQQEDVVAAIARMDADSPCDGKVNRLPADLFGREYRGQCVDGVEIWSWANMQPVAGKAKNAIFVIAVNRRNELVSVVSGDFYIVSLDPRKPNDPNRTKVLKALQATAVTQSLSSLVSPSSSEQDRDNVSSITQWIAQHSFEGGAISSGGHLSGFLYFEKIKGVNPMLMYGTEKMADTDHAINIPLGDWPDT